MRGLNRRVIEIVEPNSELIERVIVILKPGAPAAAFREEENKLERCLAGVCCKRRPRLWLAVGAAAVAAAAALLLLLL